MYTELMFVGDRDTDTSLYLNFVLQEFDMIWLIYIYEHCWEF